MSKTGVALINLFDPDCACGQRGESFRGQRDGDSWMLCMSTLIPAIPNKSRAWEESSQAVNPEEHPSPTHSLVKSDLILQEKEPLFQRSTAPPGGFLQLYCGSVRVAYIILSKKGRCFFVLRKGLLVDDDT